jgi:hypothetical protein
MFSAKNNIFSAFPALYKRVAFSTIQNEPHGGFIAKKYV